MTPMTLPTILYRQCILPFGTLWFLLFFAAGQRGYASRRQQSLKPCGTPKKGAFIMALTTDRAGTSSNVIYVTADDPQTKLFVMSVVAMEAP